MIGRKSHFGSQHVNCSEFFMMAVRIPPPLTRWFTGNYKGNAPSTFGQNLPNKNMIPMPYV